MNRIITKTYTEHTQEINSLNETLFHTANGYIGVRASLEEGVPAKWNTMRGTYLNGVYDVIPMKQAEQLCNFVDKKDTMVNVTDTMSIVFVIDGEQFDMSSGTLVSHTRTLDMEAGYSIRQVDWISPKGHHIELTVKRMTSFELLSLFLIEYSVRIIDSEADVKIISSHNAGVVNYCNPDDPRLAAESIRNLSTKEIGEKQGAICSVSETSVSKLLLCTLSKNIAVVERNGVAEDLLASAVLNDGEEKIKTKII